MAQAKSKMENGEKLHYMGEIIDIAMTGSWGFLFFSRFSFPALICWAVQPVQGISLTDGLHSRFLRITWLPTRAV